MCKTDYLYQYLFCSLHELKYIYSEHHKVETASVINKCSKDRTEKIDHEKKTFTNSYVDSQKY